MKKLNLLAIGAALCLAGCKTAEYKAAVKMIYVHRLILW